jgi:hypothetical protein
VGDALALEGKVPDREHLIDEQKVGLEVGGERVGKPRLHSRAVRLDGCVDEALDLREVDDRVEQAPALAAAEAVQGGADRDILPPGQQRVEAGAEFDDRLGATGDPDLAPVRLEQTVEDLEESALAGAVAADDGERLAAADFERDVVDRPEFPGP